MAERLQKVLAATGAGSRRQCEELIRAGRVTVDGVVASLGATVDPHTQEIAVDGRSVTVKPKEYWLLNKPVGVLSAVVDPRGRPTVVDLVPTRARVFPVGRLDLDSTGLVLLTNDGELTARLLHPRYHVDKEYVVTARGNVTEAAAGLLRRGIELEDGFTAPAVVRVEERGRTPERGSYTRLSVIIHEGRKRQVRRMMEAVGHRVTDLHRRRFAGLVDAGLAPGQVRALSPAEIDGLRKEAGL